jgi:hypothetical protein
VATCAVKNLQTDQVHLDDDALLTRLLLFDTIVIDSFDLRELSAMVQLFGAQGLRDLLATGAIRFHAFHFYSGVLENEGLGLTDGQSRFSLNFDEMHPARPGSYEITNVRISTPKEQHSKHLQIVDSIPDLRPRDVRGLKRAVADRLVQVPDGYGDRATAQTQLELDRDSGAVRRAIADRLSAWSGNPILPNEIEVRIHREGPIAIMVESNLTSKFRVSEIEAHRIIGESLLALSRLNARLENMQVCEAISGTRPDELPFYEDKLMFIAREVDPEAQPERFQRVLSIFDLPQIAGAVRDGKLSTEAFIKLRHMPRALSSAGGYGTSMT